MTKTVSVILPDPVLEKMKIMALSSGETVSDVIREAIDDYLEDVDWSEVMDGIEESAELNEGDVAEIGKQLFGESENEPDDDDDDDDEPPPPDD